MKKNTFYVLMGKPVTIEEIILPTPEGEAQKVKIRYIQKLLNGTFREKIVFFANLTELTWDDGLKIIAKYNRVISEYNSRIDAIEECILHMEQE